jgi:thioredoxin 1
MKIIEATDNELRTIIFDYPRVIVKFILEDCPVCKQLSSFYYDCAQNRKYAEITFILMNASENPVSSQEVALTGTPFFAVYKGSVLIYCSLISTEEGVENVLQKLL